MRVFEFKDPDVPRLYKGNSYKELIAQIRGYRAQNDLPEIPYLDTVVEHYLCMMPEHKGMCVNRPPLRRDLMKTIRGGISVITSAMYNAFAPQEKADERSAVCVGCPLNEFPDKTKFVEWSDALALKTIGSRKSAHHDELGTCMGCGCPLRCKVFYDGEIKLKPKEKEEMSKANENCWQVKESV
jgi:hypothetical protein